MEYLSFLSAMLNFWRGKQNRCSSVERSLEHFLVGTQCMRNAPIFRFIIVFDQQGFAEAKAYKKPGKIYYFSTFRGHRDSIIKRLVK